MKEQAQEHLDAGEFAEAEAIYRSILHLEEDDTEALFMLALARSAQGDGDEAISLMVKASEQDPDNANIHYTLGTFYMGQNAVDKARASYLQALQADPFFIDAHNGLAYAELIAGNFSAAERAANLALTEDDRNVQALVYLGTAKLEQDEVTAAVSYLQEALKEAPEHQSAQMQLGRAFLASNNPSFAMQCFQNVIRANANSGIAWEYMATAQFASGYKKEAAESFRTAISLGRSEPATLVKLAECERALGNTGEAEEIMQAAGASTIVMTAETAIIKADLQMARGNPAGALEILKKVEGPVYEGVIVARARALEQMRNESAALEMLQPLMESGRAAEDTQNVYARLLAKCGREEEANELIDSLLALVPAPIFARVFRGLQLCRLDDPKGIEMLMEAEKEPNLPDVDLRRIRRTLAETLDRAGRYEEAANYYALQAGRLAQVLAVAATAGNENRTYLEPDASIAVGLREDVHELPRDPVFFFAWPGSGWEWLASGLGAHSGIMLIADKPETQIKRRTLLSTPAGREALDSMDAVAAGKAAAAYWSDLKSGELDPGERTTVDTMWISADMLPTLARLFPAAKLVVVNRDPEDMVMDWFRSGYAGLKDMAESYKDQRDALQQYRQFLDIEFVDIDGSTLQDDAVPELKKLLKTLELPWDDEVAKRLQTIAPSVRPGRGKWSDYKAALDEPLKVFATD